MSHRQISHVMNQYQSSGIDQSVLGRFIDNHDLTRFQTLLASNSLPDWRLKCGVTTSHIKCT